MTVSCTWPSGLRAVAALAASLVLGHMTCAFAEASGPDFFRVVHLAPTSVLNIRSGPGTDHRKIDALPHDADGIRNLGCIGGLSFAEWQAASEEERSAGKDTRWCKISYDGVVGWVAGRFLGEGTAPELAGFDGLWRIIEIEGDTTSTAAIIEFTQDGRFTSFIGCNLLRGRVTLAGGALRAAEPVTSTRMACPDTAVENQERRFGTILSESNGIDYDPSRDTIVLRNDDGEALVRLSRPQG